MDNLIKIKCPWCSAVLTVKNFEGIETKSVTCPVCKQKSPFTKFKKVTGDDEKEKTHYLKGWKAAEPTDPDNLMIGRLKVKSSGQTLQLSPGRNVIGRKASASSADIQLETGENHRVSREHIVIEVKKIPGVGFVHYLSLFKERVNPTFYNMRSLLFGDCVILKNGDTISLPNFDLIFELQESEDTDF